MMRGRVGGCYLFLETARNIVVLAVTLLAALDGEHVMVVLLGGDNVFRDGLDTGLVVVLVELAVDGGGELLALDGLHDLLDDGWFKVLVNFGVVVLVPVAGMG